MYDSVLKTEQKTKFLCSFHIRAHRECEVRVHNIVIHKTKQLDDDDDNNNNS